MTRSRASPDGRIPDRDVAAKLVIIMVGLPARGKSYITKKIHRYLSWQQHNTKIFNVGNRRRIAAGVVNPADASPTSVANRADVPSQAATILSKGTKGPDIVVEEPTKLDLNNPAAGSTSCPKIDQSAKFFDPKNEAAAKLREQVALDTLDELLNYLLHQGGAVGILDATNSTIHRRQLLVERIKAREPKLGILFIESVCNDQNVSRRPHMFHVQHSNRLLCSCLRQTCASNSLGRTTRTKIPARPWRILSKESRHMRARMSRWGRGRKKTISSTSRFVTSSMQGA
jgi:6-phosphofructo-2-kinase